MSDAAIHSELQLGDVLPCYYEKHNAEYLFVSMSELIMERVFYHPEVEQVTHKFSMIEQSSLEAILDGQAVNQHYVNTLVGSIMTELEPQHRKVYVNFSSADSYAFRSLLGGMVEPEEVNPALGLRGVLRFLSDDLQQCFVLECNVIKKLLEQDVCVEVVIPFVRTQHDVDSIIHALNEQGLSSEIDNFSLSFSCDVPSAALSVASWLPQFDGVVINVDNLTQFALGLDKANEELEDHYNPQDPAVLTLVEMAIKAAIAANKPVVVVTQALQDYASLQQLLLQYPMCKTVVTM